MSENQDPSSLPVQNSVAARLDAAGFKRTSIAQAVREYIETLFGARSDIGNNLSQAINNTNAAHQAVLGPKQKVGPNLVGHITAPSANDDNIKIAA